MENELVQLTFEKIIQTKSYTVIILGGNNKRFAIYTESATGKMLQLFLTEAKRPRPLTHDLIERLFDGLDIHVKHIVINDVQDTVYYARLFIQQIKEGINHIVEMDVRPSDALILALMHNAPVYCTKEVLEQTISVEE